MIDPRDKLGRLLEQGKITPEEYKEELIKEAMKIFNTSREITERIFEKTVSQTIYEREHHITVN